MANRRMGQYGCMSVLGVFALACGDGTTATSPATQDREASRLSVTAAAVSLTGSIVYVNKGLRIYNLATSTDINLGNLGGNPEFSPDGTLITCQCSGIRVMNADGTNQRLLSPTGGVPTFDPTGTMIAFRNNGIWKVNIDGTGLTQVTAIDGYWPAWSPDGTQIAYGSSAGSAVQLFIMNADGTNRHQALTSGSIIDVTWRPSSRLLFGISSGKPTNYDLYSYDPVITSSLTRLTTGTATDFEPSWSPDGTQIAWVSGTSGPTSGIWIMNADGTGKQGPVIPKGRQGSWGR